jgi:HK97 family phage prohead protease
MPEFSVEIRSEITGNKLTGYAAVFDTYADFGSYLERLAPSAFDATLADPATDVRAYYQHDSAMLLGRQSSGTLRLSTDARGLSFELDLPATSYANDLRELASRGDLTGMSFGFIAGQEDWGTVGTRDLRTHVSVSRLIEISPVSLPAYAGTSVQLRSLTEITTAKGNHARDQLIRAKTRAHREVLN